MRAPPRISVCIPARDAARHLPTALASALAQPVDGLEVIVGDDASADGTAAVVASCGDRRVRSLRHRAPVGVAANRNACLALARGRYVAWLDADDEYLPGALAHQVAVLDAHPEVALVHGGLEVIDERGRRLPAWGAPFDGDAVEPSRTAFRHLIAANELTTSTVVARRSAHAAVGPFAPEIGPSSTDWHMWLRLALRGPLAYSARPVARYRQHRHTISRATSQNGERLRCDVRVAARALREPARPPGTARLATAALAAKALLHAGDLYTGGRREEALAAVTLAGRLGATVTELSPATRRGDDAACASLTKETLRRLAGRLEGTRFGARVRHLAATDPAWDAALARAGRAVAHATPPGAVVAAIAKWDPTLLATAGRAGCNYPDRELMPDGYPCSGAEAAAHLEALRRTRGVTHLAVPPVSAWWLEHYPELAERLSRIGADDGQCAIFELGGTR